MSSSTSAGPRIGPSSTPSSPSARRLTLDGDDVYWTVPLAGGLIGRVGKDGSGATTLFSGLNFPNDVAIDGRHDA